MKRLYAAPTLFVSGYATQETRTGDSPNIPESVNPMIYYPRPAGSVGFCL
jgi:hypothetical protein